MAYQPLWFINAKPFLYMIWKFKGNFIFKRVVRGHLLTHGFKDCYFTVEILFMKYFNLIQKIAHSLWFQITYNNNNPY